MIKLVIASNNKHKIEEISALMPKNVLLTSLNEIGCFEEIPEEADTLEGNAFQKANFIFQKYGFACFADDTGLEVDALGGKPGVKSARYSEDTAPDVPKDKRSQANVEKLLSCLKNETNRSAAFRTVICFIDDNGKTFYFEGKIEGAIIDEQRGGEGFGYDPVFVPKGYEKTFAEMPFDLKNKISHRAVATGKFIEFINKHFIEYLQ